MKIGDVVIVIDDTDSDNILHNGDVGIITRIGSDGEFCNINWDNGNNDDNEGEWFALRFKKYERKITNWRERIK